MSCRYQLRKTRLILPNINEITMRNAMKIKMKVSAKIVFWLSVLLGFAYVITISYFNRPIDTRIHSLTKDIFVSEQLKQSDFRRLKADGYATIIDIRPDGESSDQISSVDAARQADANQMRFAYVPVPHNVIPAESVAMLGTAISNYPKPILLYCRTGRRAVRTFSLVEASRSDGPDVKTILSMAQSVGFSADDLSNEIEKRIANRTPFPGERK